MSTALSTIIDEVLPDVIGCPYPLIERTVREILQEFCGATQVINRAVLATSTTAVDVAYALDNYEICDVLRMQIDTIEYKPVRQEPVDTDDELDDIQGTLTKFWYPVAGGKITITPFEVAPTEIRLVVAFRPTMLVDTVEDTFYDDWHDTIVAGAKAKLLLMPKKAWSDPDFGPVFRKEYRDGKFAALTRTLASLNINTITRPTGFI